MNAAQAFDVLSRASVFGNRAGKWHGRLSAAKAESLLDREFFDVLRGIDCVGRVALSQSPAAMSYCKT
jgi:hypothetical protein